jgi:hypothetical protein
MLQSQVLEPLSKEMVEIVIQLSVVNPLIKSFFHDCTIEHAMQLPQLDFVIFLARTEDNKCFAILTLKCFQFIEFSEADASKTQDNNLY